MSKIKMSGLLHIVPEVLVNTIRQDQETKWIHIGKKEVKILLFLDDIIICMDNIRESTKKLCKHWENSVRHQSTKLYRNRYPS